MVQIWKCFHSALDQACRRFWCSIAPRTTELAVLSCPGWDGITGMRCSIVVLPPTRGTAKTPAPNAARASLMPRNPTIEKTISQEYGHLQHPGMPSILMKVDTPALSSYFRHCTEEPHPALCGEAKECQASCCFVLAIFACPVCMFLHINMLSIPRERSSATKDGLQYQAVRLYRRLSRPLRLLLLRKALSAVHRCTSWT